jgi:putative N6-adenine-specific DNA methylase
MVLNPPYGERIGAKGRGSREAFEAGGTPSEFFAAMASHWKRHYAGWTAWVLSPEMKLPSLMRLKESRRVPLWNGPIECRLFRFDLVAGSARGTG